MDNQNEFDLAYAEVAEEYAAIDVDGSRVNFLVVIRTDEFRQGLAHLRCGVQGDELERWARQMCLLSREIRLTGDLESSPEREIARELSAMFLEASTRLRILGDELQTDSLKQYATNIGYRSQEIVRDEPADELLPADNDESVLPGKSARSVR